MKETSSSIGSSMSGPGNFQIDINRTVLEVLICFGLDTSKPHGQHGRRKKGDMIAHGSQKFCHRKCRQLLCSKNHADAYHFPAILELRICCNRYPSISKRSAPRSTPANIKIRRRSFLSRSGMTKRREPSKQLGSGS